MLRKFDQSKINVRIFIVTMNENESGSHWPFLVLVLAVGTRLIES